MKKNELKVWENRSIAHEKEWKYIKTFQSKVKRSIENSYLALLDVVEVEEEVEAAGNDDGACSIASLDDAVEEGSGCAVSFVRIAFLDPAPAPGDIYDVVPGKKCEKSPERNMQCKGIVCKI